MWTLNLNMYLIRQGNSQSSDNTVIKSLNYYIIVFNQLDYFCILVNALEHIKWMWRLFLLAAPRIFILQEGKFFYILMSLLIPLFINFILYYSHVGYKNLRKLLGKINSNVYIIEDKIMFL